MSSSSPVDWGHLRHTVSRAHVLCACVVVCAAVLFSAEQVKAQDASQDVAEAARQARARKAERAQRESHIYTNEDLQRTRIVSDENSGNIAARKPDEVTPSATAAQSAEIKPAAATAPATPAAMASGAAENGGESLGEVARRYRREKAARQEEAARKDDAHSPFHMERKMAPQPALAAMAPKLIVVLPRPVVQPEKPSAATSATAVKRDPFQRPAIRTPQTQMRPSETRTNSLKTDSAAQPRASRTTAPVTPQPASPTATRFAVPVIANGAARVHAESRMKAKSPTPDTVAARRKTGTSLFAPGVKTYDVVPRAVPSAQSSVSNWSASGRSPKAVVPVAPLKETSGGLTLTAPVAPDNPVATPGTVIVEAGDSLWKLSRRYLGSGSRWPEWVRGNPGLRDPRRIRAGAVLAMPGFARQAGLNAKAPSPAEQVVRSGDSLWKISVTRFGSGRFWTCLQGANPSLRDVGLIYPGQILRVPDSCGGEGRNPRPAAP